jgi:UDP-glucose:(heptosyl)LPS alpha-1,3-glucosyltransferase
MNIALIRSRYDPYGGAERFVQNALAALGAGGAKLTIVTRHWPQAAAAGSTVETLIVDPFFLGSLWRDAGFARAACAALGKRRFDLVQSHERLDCCDIYRAGDGVHAEWLAQRHRALGAWRQLGVRLNPHHRYLLAAERRLFSSPRLKAVICNSRMVRDEIARHFGTPQDKLRVIHNSVDSSVFHSGLRTEHRAAVRARLGIPADAPVFLFVGSGFERKGLQVFLHALAKVAGYGIVAGKDKRLASYRALAASLGIAARVHFLGGVGDVRPSYGAADVFVLPTLYDPLPNACLEAMACGLPVITSEKCGAAEFIQSGEGGFVCDALDIASFADAMQACAARARTMGEAARAGVAALTPQRMAQEYVALYRGLLAVE